MQGEEYDAQMLEELSWNNLGWRFTCGRRSRVVSHASCDGAVKEHALFGRGLTDGYVVIAGGRNPRRWAAVGKRPVAPYQCA